MIEEVNASQVGRPGKVRYKKMIKLKRLSTSLLVCEGNIHVYSNMKFSETKRGVGFTACDCKTEYCKPFEKKWEIIR